MPIYAAPDDLVLVLSGASSMYEKRLHVPAISGCVENGRRSQHMRPRLARATGSPKAAVTRHCSHRSGSDVDFLVVMPNGTDTRKSAVAMMSALRNAEAAKDVIVATPEILDRFGDTPGMLYRSALREGVVLYER